METAEIVTMAHIREALEVGHKPMLSEMPQICRDKMQEIRDLTDHVDLMVDEFKRIKALCHDTYLHNTEIAGLCERAITNTVQRVPVILQRDQAERRAEQLQMVVEKIARVVSGEDQVADDDTEGLIWIRRFIAESV